MYIIRLLNPKRFSYRVLRHNEAGYRLCLAYILRLRSERDLGRECDPCKKSKISDNVDII